MTQWNIEWSIHKGKVLKKTEIHSQISHIAGGAPADKSVLTVYYLKYWQGHVCLPTALVLTYVLGCLSVQHHLSFLQVAERIAQLQEALLHCGKFQDALEPLLSWLSDTEELVANQKPPSAEYRVVKAQIQEQKVRGGWRNTKWWQTDKTDRQI